MAGRRKQPVLPAWVARWAANVLLLGLTLYLALLLAWSTWFLVWREQPVAPVYQAGAAGPGNLEVSTPLAAFEFFGQPSLEQAAVAESVRRNAPETRLSLKLEGILLAERPEYSGAIVSGPGNVTAHYRVGERLPGDAELVEVEPGRILIRRQGAYESLAFDEEFQAPVASAQATDVTPQSQDDFVSEAQARLDREGATALLDFGLSPVDDGGTQGYVFDGSNAMLRAINLRAGDVITSINGYPLGDLEQDRQLIDSLRSERHLQVEVERGGARFTVTYALPE